MMNTNNYKIVGTYNGKYIYMFYYPSHIDIHIGNNIHSFKTYDNAMLYLQSITRKPSLLSIAKQNKELR